MTPAAFDRRNFLRGVAGVGLAAALPTSLAACSSDDNTPAAQPAGDPNAPAKLTFWTWTTGID